MRSKAVSFALPCGVLVLVVCGGVACGGDADTTRPSDGAAATGAGTHTGGGGARAGSGGTPAFGNTSAGNGAQLGTGGIAACDPAPCMDQTMRLPDDDGFSVADGDCDDFDANLNPGAFDVPNNGIDEDCQGGDATTASCDGDIDIASDDPLDAARAIELCPSADEAGRRWGVISARWTTPDGLGMPGLALSHGILPELGSAFAPRAGERLLAISSGVARAPDQPGFQVGCSANMPATSTGFPQGFDGRSPSCPPDTQATSIVDAVALEVTLRVPTNATALSFDSAFFTSEYPVYICTEFNDYFQVIVQPKRNGGSPDGNVVFDLDGNPVSVNNSLLRACDPGMHNGKTFECPLGLKPLTGTGYEDCGWENGPGIFGGLFAGGFFGGGAADAGPPPDVYGASTGWLSTELAVEPGEKITVRIAIWDSGDSALDSLAVIDNVRFRLKKEPPPPEVPVTMPVGPD